MSRKIEREIEFTDWWFKEHKKAPTYADAIEWAEKEMIDKACKYLKSLKFQEFAGAPFERLLDDYEIKQFRKAMEK